MESSWPGLVLKPSRQPRSLASQRAGFVGNYRVFPETPVGERSGETTLLLTFHGSADHVVELCQVLFPAPFGLGMAARPSVARPPALPHFDGRGGEDARFQRLGAAGEGAGRCTGRASLWRSSQLEAPRSESRVHPPFPAPILIYQGRRRPGLRNSLPPVTTQPLISAGTS